MDGYYIRPSKVTPSIYFSPNKGILDLRGKSSPENPLNFYNHIFDTVDKIAGSEIDLMTANMAFEYFNTSSSKCLYMLFKKLDELHQAGKKVAINWFYEEGDEDMMEAGEDMNSFFTFDLNFKEIPEIKVLGEEKEAVAA